MKNKHVRGTLIALYIKIKTTGLDVVQMIKSLKEEANDHRLVVKKSDSNTLFEIPFVPATLISAGILLFAPLLAVLGVIAALAGQIEVVVDRYPKPVYIKVETTESTSGPKSKS